MKRPAFIQTALVTAAWTAYGTALRGPVGSPRAGKSMVQTSTSPIGSASK